MQVGTCVFLDTARLTKPCTETYAFLPCVNLTQLAFNLVASWMVCLSLRMCYVINMLCCLDYCCDNRSCCYDMLRFFIFVEAAIIAPFYCVLFNCVPYPKTRAPCFFLYVSIASIRERAVSRYIFMSGGVRDRP